MGLQHWGDTPYPVPSFVVTHEKLDKLQMESAAFTFVNEGVAEALKQAQAAAAGVIIVMGADVAQQMLKESLPMKSTSSSFPSCWQRNNRFEFRPSAS